MIVNVLFLGKYKRWIKFRCALIGIPLSSHCVVKHSLVAIGEEVYNSSDDRDLQIIRSFPAIGASCSLYACPVFCTSVWPTVQKRNRWSR